MKTTKIKQLNLICTVVANRMQNETQFWKRPGFSQISVTKE
jgi:hypothetical protein